MAFFNVVSFVFKLGKVVLKIVLLIVMVVSLNQHFVSVRGNIRVGQLGHWK